MRLSTEKQLDRIEMALIALGLMASAIVAASDCDELGDNHLDDLLTAQDIWESITHYHTQQEEK